MIYIDANVMYSYLFETPMTESAERILENANKVTSRTTVNEAIYVTFRKLAKEREGITNIHDIKRFVKTGNGRKLLGEAYSLVLELLALSGIDVVEEETDPNVIRGVSEKYGLLPNDSIIVATCIKHGITRSQPSIQTLITCLS